MKKVFKKSIAFVIAALMIFSTLPLTPPISAEAATEAELQSLRNEITLTKVNNLQPEKFNANGYFANDVATGGFNNLLYCSQKVSYGPRDKWIDTVMFKLDMPKYTVMAYDGDSTVGFPIVAEVTKSGYRPEVEYIKISNTDVFELRQLWYGYITGSSTTWPNKNSSSYNEDFGYNSKNVFPIPDKNVTYYFNNEIFYKGTGNKTDFYEFIDGTIQFIGKKNNKNEATFVNTEAKQYVINYKPIYDLIKGNSTNLVMLPTSTGYTNSNMTFKGLFEYVNNNPNRFTVDSLVKYYKAVKTICNMKVAGEFIFTDDSTVDANVKTAANVIKNAYNNYNTAVANLVRQYEVKFISNDGTENIKYYPVDTTISSIVIPENTARNYDNAKHYSYSWPEITISSLTKDSSFNEIKTEAVHDLNSQIISQATCTDSGSTKYTCDCGYTYTDDSIPAATGHSWGEWSTETAATCIATGTEKRVCNNDTTHIETRDIAINPNAHNWGEWTSISDTQHQRECANDNSHTEIDSHTFENGVCKVCTKQQTFTIKFKNQDGSEISSIVYNYGETVQIPDLPPTKYTYNNNGTHTKTTYSWNFTPNPLAQGNATYQVTASNSDPVACNFVWKDTTTVDGKTIDTFECSVCKGTISKTVADMSALNPAIEELEALVNADGANYKYEANALANAKNVVATAKDFVQKADKYALQAEVDAQASTVNNTITTLTTTGLAQYTVTFNLVNGDTGDPIKTDYSVMKYGDIAEKSYTFNKDEDGFPEYVVCKWTKKVLNDKGEEVESVINSTSNDISDLVKENATYTCYVLKFKASTEGATETTTRVRYLDKSGNTLKIAYAKVGSNYQIDSSVSIPNIPYYKFDGWKCRFGTPENVGTREIVYQATYKFNDTVSNRCQIVGLKGVLVNGVESYSAIYDEKIELTGADKFAYANADGSIIAPINENYIFAPHLNGVDKTIYITKVETPIEDAKSIITGVFTTDNDPTYNYLVINAQYYLPEGAKAVEAGAVIGKQNDANVLKVGSALKVVSDTQGENHEYSLQMSYSKNKSGTLYARSYLIYVDSNGNTHTVYSDIAECVLN